MYEAFINGCKECRERCVGDMLLIANDAFNQAYPGAYDSYVLTHLELPPSADYGDTTYFYLVLGDSTAGAFVDDGLPTSLDFVDFNTTRFLLTPLCGPTVRLGGEVHTLDVRLIPEPATGLLAFAGTSTVLTWNDAIHGETHPIMPLVKLTVFATVSRTPPYEFPCFLVP